jgi:hypothetical protein
MSEVYLAVGLFYVFSGGLSKPLAAAGTFVIILNQ